MNKSLSRSIGFWLLLVVSLAATAVGGWLISGQIATMTTTLLDGTATGIEVYVGQSLVVVGAGVLGAGIVGILLTLGLVAARSLVPAPAPTVVEAIDWTAEAEEEPTPAAPESTPSPTAEATGDVVPTTDASVATAPSTAEEAGDEETANGPSVTR
ncbi:hypothetical protein [Microbacterium paraoxydans]|uniref:hypothetical protein n=1 Tax=Microbacterium paraoxydans TaxID=199592 RepID=UPI001CFAF31B|nr:hypothetical protein [Microbacterium paraoxydans]